MKPLLKILPLLLEASILRTTIASECSSALGMESRAIWDDQLSASSSYDEDWRPKDARLNNNRAWAPKTNSQSEWLQIDLLERKVISGIQTQGRRVNGLLWSSTSYYVKSFKLSYSDDGTDWNRFQENGSDKIFVGNSNANDVKDIDIDPPIRARFIRLMAETWRRRVVVRLELLGCELRATTTQLPSTTTTTQLPSTTTTTLSTTHVTTTVSTTAFTTTKKQTSTRTNAVNTEGLTPVVPPRSSTAVTSVSDTPSPSSNNTSEDGLAGSQAGTTSGAIIGGAVAAGVVVLIIAIVASIFFVRRRQARHTDDKQSPPPPEDSGTVDSIYYGGVTFAANGNASTNGNVSIGQSEGMVDNDLYAYAGTANGDVTIDQSEGMVDNHIYAGTNNDNAAIDQSEGTVDNQLYAGTGDACAETSHHGVDDSNQDNVYYNMAHTSDEGSVENDIYC